MKKAIFATGIVLLAANSGYAAPYQVELEAGYASLDGEVEIEALGRTFDIDTDKDTWILGGTYYISPVNDSKGPLAEAAFLDRASGFTILYSESEAEYERVQDEEETDSYAFGGRFVDKDSGWIISAAYGYSETDFFDVTDEVDTWQLGVGKYIAENTAITLDYATVEVETDFDGRQFENEADTYTLALKHVAPLSGQMYFGIDASFAHVDEENADNAEVWSGAFTLYPQRNLGVGVSVSLTDSDDDETEVYSVFGRWFVTEQVALSLSYDMQENDEQNSEGDIISTGVTLRF